MYPGMTCGTREATRVNNAFKFFGSALLSNAPGEAESFVELPADVSSSAVPSFQDVRALVSSFNYVCSLVFEYNPSSMLRAQIRPLYRDPPK